MSTPTIAPVPLVATAYEVLPQFGMAFLVDDQETTWTITKAMQGPGLDTLRAGQRIELTLEHQAGFKLVRAYQPLN